MPEIFRKYGFRFFFYMNEHLPIHVHVRKGDGEAKFEINPQTGIKLKSSIEMKPSELKKAQKLAEEHLDLIITAWIKTFNN